MRKHDFSRDISAGIDVRQVGLTELIHFDRSALQLDVIERFETQQIRAAANRNQHFFRLINLAISRHFAAVQRLHFRARKDINTRFLIFLQQDLYDFRIEVRQDGRHGFDNRHRYTEFMIKRCELHTDDAATDNNNRFRQFSRRQSVRTIPNSRIVLDTGNRRYKIRRTRTNHEVLCFVCLAVALKADN